MIHIEKNNIPKELNECDVLLYGGGYTGRVIIELFRQKGIDIEAIIDDDEGLQGEKIQDIPVISYQHFVSVYSSKKDIRLISVSKYFNGPWMKLLHKDIIGNKTFEPRFKNGEDSLFMFSVSDKINQIKMANSNATYYRRFRRDGACYSKFSIAYSIRNNLLLLAYYLGYWLSNPLKYNFLFFINRQCANIKDMIYKIFNIRF